MRPRLLALPLLIIVLAGAASNAHDLTTPLPAIITGQIVDVLQYGCVGDGVADDALCLRTALNSGKRLYLPGGKTFLFNQMIHGALPSNTIICGAGATSIIQRSLTYNGDAFVLAPNATNITFCDLKYDGNRTATSLVGAQFLNDPNGTSTTAHITFDRFIATNYSDKIFNSEGKANWVRITHSTFLNSYQRGTTSFAGAFAHIEGNYFDNMNDGCIDIINADYAVITGNVCNATGSVKPRNDGIFVNYGDNIAITGNTVHAPTGRAIAILQGDSGRAQGTGVVIAGNSVIGIGTHALFTIHLDNTIYNATIVGNHTVGGIFCGSRGAGRVVTGNTVVTNGPQLADIVCGVSNSRIVGNRSANIVLDLVTGTAATDISVIDNEVNAAGRTYGIRHLNEGTATLARLEIRGNRVLGTPAIGIAVETVRSNAAILDNFVTGTTLYSLGSIANLNLRNLIPSTATPHVNYSVTLWDDLVLGTAGAGGITVTLPNATVAAPGRPYTVKKVDSAAGAVLLNTVGAQTIDGASTYSLAAQWKYVRVVSNGSNWLVVANN